jgi:hypothetical protein
MVCPFCHKYSKRDLMFEVVFDNFTITFKCEECKKTARIYLKMIEYGQIEYEKMGSD